MARQRRGPELRGTLGTLLRTAGNLRDVLERGAREGRSRVEDALANRRRTDALAELGEIVLDLIRRGEVDVDELPEARDIVQHLDELDAGDDDDHAGPRTIRKRFDTRRAEDDGTASSTTWAPPNRPRAPSTQRIWRPTVDAAPAKTSGGIRFDDSDDDLAEYMHPDDVPKKSDP